MSIEVVGVNQSWTQLSSILLPVSTASSATSRNSTTTLTTIENITTKPSSPATSEKAITITETIEDSGNSPLSTEPPSDPLSDSCLAVSSIEDDGQENNEDVEAEEGGEEELSQLTATVDNSDEAGQLQDQQQLSVTSLPPLPDLIPIRKAQQLQLQEIDIKSCDNNQQQDHQQQQPQPQSATAKSTSSQILTISNKQTVEVEEDNRGGEDDEEEDQATNYDDGNTNTTSNNNNNEEDDPQHSTFEEATSTSLATTSTVLDNQSTITASTTTATSFSLYPTDSNMSQQHSSMLLDSALTSVPSLTGLPKTGAKKRGRKIKTEIEDPELCPIPHRKSDRRRVARDIFLVFEEHPANRRRGKGGKAKQPKARPKPKFAHLMTEPKRQNKKTAVGTVPPVRIKSEPKTPTTTTFNTFRKSTTPGPAATTAKASAPKTSTPKATPALKTTNSTTTVPRVKPIFLFVKQDDTRIVEVRCEDYDKRNRIRLTKTANGWRAIPRTDPSSTRFAKLLPNPAVKVKQEMFEEALALRNVEVPAHQQQPQSPPSSSPQQPEPPSSPIRSTETDVVAPIEPLKPLKILQPAQLVKASLKNAASHAAKKKKKKKKKKKRKLAEEHLKEQKEAVIDNEEENSKHQIVEGEEEEEEERESEELLPEVPQNPIISTEPNHLVYESTNHEREEILQEEQDDEVKEIDEEDDAEVQEVPIAVETPEISKQPEITPEAEDDDVEEIIPNYEENEDGLMLHHHHMEPNNNEPTEELAKNLTQISDDLELDDMPQFMQDVNVNSVRALQLCPETGLFIQKTPIVEEDHGIDREHEPEPELHHHDHEEDHEDHDAPVVLSDSFDDSDVDTKNLKDLLDDADLLQHCSDNAMSGAELLDSLVKRGCEDNHISGDEPSIKETICLDDFENEDDDVLMQPEPVADIISRLGGSLAASPKCLSFNEAGEIEGLHGELFQSNTQNDPFSRHTLEELSITIKDLEKSAEESYNSPVKQKPAESVTIVSPDSCVDEMPKDLTCKKSQIAAEKEKPSQPQPLLERPNSRSSDAIQSPQPSGLPAVPPSPDLVHSNKSSKNVFLEQLLNSSNSISPKICSSVTVTPIKIPNAPTKQQQKEPLDLGKHRKSASPTVSCSEEAKRIQTVTIDEESPDEPLQKRIKRESEEDIHSEKSHTENLIEMLSSGKDPDPLTQLRLLIRNPEWKVPDPILVPKDRLSAVLASPAREIPLLLTTRPELRLPEAFAYPAILQDPDILVISMAQLETILQKQVEITRPKAKTPPIPQVTIEAIPNPVKNRAPEKPVPAPSPDITVSSKKPAPSPTTPQPAKQAANNFLNPLMGDIDAATLAAFNQMLWLPYIGQMAPEFIKAIAGLQNGNGLAELMPLLQQQQNAQHTTQQQQNQKSAFPTPPQFHPMAAAAAAAGLSNPLAASAAFQNPIEMAMWQEALTQAQMQRMMKLNAAAALAAQQQREMPKKSAISEAKANASRSHYGVAATSSSKPTPSNPPPSYHHSQTSHASQRHQVTSAAAEKSNSTSSRSVPNPFYRPPGSTGNSDSTSAHRAKQKSQQHQHHQDQKPRVTCKSLSNLLQPERLSEAKMSNLMAMPGFDFGFNGSVGNAAANPFQFASAAAAAAAAASAGRTSGAGQYGGSNSNVSSGGSSSSSTNNGNHAAALHRNNHSASSMLGNMTPSHQHQQLQHHQQQLQHHQLQQQHQQQQHQQQQHQLHQQQQQQQQQHQQQQAKLKVKPGSHLIDPAALQRRLLNCEDLSEVGSTTNGLEEMMTDPNAALWHPLFGNTQKAGYNSPWQWTTVTASGE